MLARIVEHHTRAVNSLLGQETLLRVMKETIASCIEDGGTVFLCGNGGSAADCQHIAAELVGRFKKERRGYPAVALTTDTSILTAVGNDYGFENVFSRQVEALVRNGDVLLCFSTSGNSDNVINAARAAKDRRAVVLAFTGHDGGKLARVADVTLRVASDDTARVQECHILAGHALCEMIEDDLQ